jgi:hypothetical protein
MRRWFRLRDQVTYLRNPQAPVGPETASTRLPEHCGLLALIIGPGHSFIDASLTPSRSQDDSLPGHRWWR